MTTFASHNEFRFEYVPMATQVAAKPGDIVFLDLNGTKADSLRVPDGVSVFKMTGGFSKADLRKPFEKQDIERLLQIAKRRVPEAA
jgi:hypothetical protein